MSRRDLITEALDYAYYHELAKRNDEEGRLARKRLRMMRLRKVLSMWPLVVFALVVAAFILALAMN